MIKIGGIQRLISHARFRSSCTDANSQISKRNVITHTYHSGISNFAAAPINVVVVDVVVVFVVFVVVIDVVIVVVLVVVFVFVFVLVLVVAPLLDVLVFLRCLNCKDISNFSNC